MNYDIKNVYDKCIENKHSFEKMSKIIYEFNEYSEAVEEFDRYNGSHPNEEICTIADVEISPAFTYKNSCNSKSSYGVLYNERVNIPGAMIERLIRDRYEELTNEMISISEKVNCVSTLTKENK